MWDSAKFLNDFFFFLYCFYNGDLQTDAKDSKDNIFIIRKPTHNTLVPDENVKV